ncbi:XRE family transcriptional regulator [Burkholderia gladioli]|nr:XRE family transcriptional regulator [Burkholderia gladioli]
MKYTAPEPSQLRKLKSDLNYSGAQMADLFGLASPQQWRKYSGDGAPREMSLPMLFLAMSLLDRSATVEQVFDKCRAVGATIELDSE